jgi:hypothetical protein
MGSRFLPLALVLGALVADAAGLHRLATYAVLVAVVGAAAAAFVGIGDLIAGKGSVLCAVTSGIALVLLLVGSAARAAAPVGAHVPTPALSTLVLAAAVYAVPLFSWVLAPVVPRQRPRLRTHP